MNGLGYSCATIPAMRHATAACSDGNDVPPFQNFPFPLSWYGRSRPVANLSASTAIRASIAPSPLRNPVSRWCSFGVDESKKIEAGGAAGHGVNAVVRNVLVAQNGVWRVRKMTADIAVGHE